MQRMISGGTWTLGDIKHDILVDVFISKSVWHENYTKYFPLVEKYPQLQRWLENEDGAPSGLEVFGVVKAAYKFADLKRVIEELAKSAKGKRKARDSGGGEASDKKTKKISKKYDSSL